MIDDPHAATVTNLTLVEGQNVGYISLANETTI